MGSSCFFFPSWLGKFQHKGWIIERRGPEMLVDCRVQVRVNFQAGAWMLLLIWVSGSSRFCVPVPEESEGLSLLLLRKSCCLALPPYEAFLSLVGRGIHSIQLGSGGLPWRTLHVSDNVLCRGQTYLTIVGPGSCWSRKTDLKWLSLECRGRGKGGTDGRQGLWVRVPDIPTSWSQLRAWWGCGGC